MSGAHASPALCALVRERAPYHVACSSAPSTWAALQEHARDYVDLLIVFDGGCDDTIYPDAKTNHAFRAWHDSIHLANGYSFSRADEIKVGLIHMQQARAAGLPQSDQDMLIADTIGQVEYYYSRREYVKNQSLFVAAVLSRGLKAVIDSGEVY